MRKYILVLVGMIFTAQVVFAAEVGEGSATYWDVSQAVQKGEANGNPLVCSFPTEDSELYNSPVNTCVSKDQPAGKHNKMCLVTELTCQSLEVGQFVIHDIVFFIDPSQDCAQVSPVDVFNSVSRLNTTVKIEDH